MVYLAVYLIVMEIYHYATGEAIKKNWIPIAAVIAIAGGALVWFSRRKHHQSNN